jgi:hypothetical protein
LQTQTFKLKIQNSAPTRKIVLTDPRSDRSQEFRGMIQEPSHTNPDTVPGDDLDDPWADDPWASDSSASATQPAPPKPSTPPAVSPATPSPIPSATAQPKPRKQPGAQFKPKTSKLKTTPPSAWESSTIAAAEFVVDLLTNTRPKLQQIRSQLTSRLHSVQAWGQSCLRLVRRMLPAAWTANLPDPVLGGLLVALVLFLLWLLVAVPRTFATTPVVDKAEPEAIAPRPRVSDNPLNLPSLKSDRPPPPLDLAPQPELIANLQAQVSEVSDRYGSDLIRDIQANFRISRLTVQLGQGWYDLSALRQKQLAADLLARSQQLQFRALELVDEDNLLLARSPFVGDEMVLVRTVSRY